MKKQKNHWGRCVITFPVSCEDHILRTFFSLLFLLLGTIVSVSAQTTVATLPFELKIDALASLKNVAGLKYSSSFSSSTFYSDGALRFSGSSDYLIVGYDTPAKNLSIKKTSSTKGSVFVISGSVDGGSYMLIEELTVTSDKTQTLTTSEIIPREYRYLKVGYRQVSNTGISWLQITSGEAEGVLVPPPTFSLLEGTYTEKQYVEMSSAPETTIYYTTDGSAPTSNSFRYEGAAIEINATTTLKAVACDAEGRVSAVTSATYTLLINVSTPKAYQLVFHETFEANAGLGGNDGNWDNFKASSAAGATMQPGWTFTNCFSASACILLGTSSNEKGIATTPALGVAGEALLSFRAAAWNTSNEVTDLVMKISNTGGRLNAPGISTPAQSITLSLKKGEFTSYTIAVTGAANASKISFSVEPTASKKGRFFLDEVKVYVLAEAETEASSVAALSGKWSTDVLYDGGFASGHSETALVLDSRLELFDDVLIDNAGGNPNLLVFSQRPLSVVNGLNVVDGSFQGNAQLTDLKTFHTPQRISGSVSLKRTFSGVQGHGGWQVLCLPFTVATVTANGVEYIPYSEWIITTPQDKGFFWLKTVDDQDENNDIDTDASIIEANRPYLIAFPDYGYADYPLLNISYPTEFTFAGNAVESTDNLACLHMRSWDFHPVFSVEEGENCYILNAEGSRFERAATNATTATQPFRPYLIYKGGIEEATPGCFIIGMDHVPLDQNDISRRAEGVSIFTVEGGVLLVSDREQEVFIYTLRGDLLACILVASGGHAFNLPAGSYIVNGQIVLIP